MAKKTDGVAQYKKKVKEKLGSLEEVFLSAAVGDFKAHVVVPEEEDEFTGLFVGIKLMTDTINEKIDDLKHINKNLEKIIRQRTKALREAYKISGLGSWEYNLQTKKLRWVLKISFLGFSKKDKNPFLSF